MGPKINTKSLKTMVNSRKTATIIHKITAKN